MSGKRKKHTPEFREDGARLVIETGRPISHVAAEIGVGEQLLGRWVRLAHEAAGREDTAGVLDADERAELERLRKENTELRRSRAPAMCWAIRERITRVAAVRTIVVRLW
ncbi:transposase [Mycolicibacterium sp.]|uniref:transposase n=1 Tax=Mycolicibacterium sp. TaxID=2320850 RepID=UPI0037CAC5C4